MFDTDWYLLDRGGRRYGPYDRELIEQLATRSELRADTPVWHPGLARWQRAERVLSLPKVERVEVTAASMLATAASALAPARPRATPASAPTPAPAQPRAQSQSQSQPRTPIPRSSAPHAPVARPVPRPAKTAAPSPAAKGNASLLSPPQAARRAFAALFDLLCVYAAFRISRGVLARGMPDPGWRVGPLFFIAWGLLDAAWTARVATTPGKALMAVRVYAAQDQNLAWPRALIRSGALPLLLLLLTLRGGFTSLVAIAVLLFTASRLRAGFAPWWDDIARARVSYGELTASKQALAAIALMVVLGIVVFA